MRSSVAAFTLPSGITASPRSHNEPLYEPQDDSDINCPIFGDSLCIGEPTHSDFGSQRKRLRQGAGRDSPSRRERGFTTHLS
jgi:hypothetical protein